MNKLIIFDCDGVLVDSESLSIDVLVKQLKDRGVTATKEEISKCFKGAKLDLIIKHIEKTYSVELPSVFGQEFRELMNKEFESSLRPIKGIDEALKKIDFPICVASSGPLEKIQNSLKITNLTHFFGENIFSSYLINSWKPEPDIFLHAAKEMNFSPEDCIVIEDSPLGVQAGIKANMKVFGFCESSERSELEREGAITFNNMSDLPNLISLH